MESNALCIEAMRADNFSFMALCLILCFLYTSMLAWTNHKREKTMELLMATIQREVEVCNCNTAVEEEEEEEEM